MLSWKHTCLIFALAIPVQAQPPEPVVVQLPYFHQFQFAGFYAAQAKGYFAEEGLEVELREGAPGVRPVDEVVNGRAQYGVGATSVFVDRLNGAEIVALAAVFQHSPFALMVRADSGISTPLELVGRRIAVNAASRNVELRAIFHFEGILPGQYQSVPDLPQTNELITGEADAIMTFVTDTPYDVAQAGFRFRLIRPADYGADFYGDILFAHTSEVSENPERVRSFRRAVLRGWEYALDHPDEIIDLIQRDYVSRHRQLSRGRLAYEAAETQKLINSEIVAVGHMNPGRCRKIAEVIVALGLAPDAGRVEGWVWQEEQSRVSVWARGVGLTAGIAIVLTLLALLANQRLKRLVDQRTAELRESERRQREIFDLAPNPIAVEDLSEIANRLAELRAAGVTDLRARLAAQPGLIEEMFALKHVVAANRLTLQAAGFASIEEMDRRLREIMTPDALNGFAEELLAMWEGRGRLTVAKIYRPVGTGRSVHMLVNWSVERVDGRFDYSRVRLVFTDITEIRAAEKALEESEERYRNLFETTPNPMYIFDAETLRFVMLNEAAVQRYGFTRQEFSTMTVLDLRPAEEAQRLSESMAKYRDNPPVQAKAFAAGLWRHRCKDGTTLIVEVYTHSVVLNGRTCILALPFDITAKLAAERALRDSETRYRELFENAIGGVYRLSPESRYISVNPALARMYGFDSPAEMLAWNERERGGLSYADEEEHRRFVELITRHGKVENFESRIIDRHGQTVWISETSRAVHDDEGRLLYYEGFVTDITARRRLEAEMTRASKLEAVGILAGGIAHDFNNILTVVLGNVTLAEMDTATDSSVRRMLHDAKRATLRARDLTQQLLTFAKGGDPVRAAFALPELLRESATFAMHGSSSRCEVDVPGDLWPANADKGQIGQVVQNLVINAVQAMPNGGLVRIAAANTRLAAGAVGSLPAGDYVKFSVRDTGTGIAAEHLAKIFDPYFTTKQQGSGLGLATVYSIIRKHQGHIEVESKLGTGTTFSLWLPAAEHSEGTAPAEPAIEASLRARVLFMDDEEPIREMAQMFITRLGAEFVGAADGAAAIEAYRSAREQGKPFDVVVMDLTVPGGMGGREAMEKLHAYDPKVRAIVSSGYSRDPVLGSYRRHGFSGILPKPYGLEQLRKVLIEVATRPGSRSPF